MQRGKARRFFSGFFVLFTVCYVWFSLLKDERKLPKDEIFWANWHFKSGWRPDTFSISSQNDPQFNQQLGSDLWDAVGRNYLKHFFSWKERSTKVSDDAQPYKKSENTQSYKHLKPSNIYDYTESGKCPTTNAFRTFHMPSGETDRFLSHFLKPLANGLTSARKVCKCLLSFFKKVASGFASTCRSKSVKGHGLSQVFTPSQELRRVTCECWQSQMFKILAPDLQWTRQWSGPRCLLGVASTLPALTHFSKRSLRPNSHKTRTRNASKWDLLLSMGVFTLVASNIKGKTFQFVCAWCGASCVN